MSLGLNHATSLQMPNLTPNHGHMKLSWPSAGKISIYRSLASAKGTLPRICPGMGRRYLK